jgi:RNA polymerase-binding transcription factor DksA
MADVIDIANDRALADNERAIADARAVAAAIPAGTPGECERCGQDSPRLVGGACAPCRTRYRLA